MNRYADWMARRPRSEFALWVSVGALIFAAGLLAALVTEPESMPHYLSILVMCFGAGFQFKWVYYGWWRR